MMMMIMITMKKPPYQRQEGEKKKKKGARKNNLARVSMSSCPESKSVESIFGNLTSTLFCPPPPLSAFLRVAAAASFVGMALTMDDSRLRLCTTAVV
jgi:hypothetical protein